jgi:hypothetical protein
MRDDYPKVAVVLGDRFAPTVRGYIGRHPSDHPSLRHFGRHFPEFLGAGGLSDAPPWLADLARLEWARIEAFDAADGPTLSFDDVQRLPDEAWPDLRLTLVPSFRSRCAPPEARAIARLDAVEPFSAICEAFADASCPGIDDAAERAFGALRQWLADGWVAAWPAPSVGRAPL